jgi:hypothetical protein
MFVSHFSLNTTLKIRTLQNTLPSTPTIRLRSLDLVLSSPSTASPTLCMMQHPQILQSAFSSSVDDLFLSANVDSLFFRSYNLYLPLHIPPLHHNTSTTELYKHIRHWLNHIHNDKKSFLEDIWLSFDILDACVPDHDSLAHISD